MNEASTDIASPIREGTVNFAIGPSCPVRCEGCYNHFGNTLVNGDLVSGNDVLDFASEAKQEGVSQSTVSGGDPLSHPEIVPIVQGLKFLDLNVKLDTVGTYFLDEAPMIFKGRGS